MAKKGIHPEWHEDAKVICNGEEVLTTSGTQGSYTGACCPGALVAWGARVVPAWQHAAPQSRQPAVLCRS